MTGQVQVADGDVRGESIVVTAPATGLSSTEAARRLQADGPNAAAAPPRRHLATRILHQLSDPLVALLLAAAVVTTVLRDYPDTVVILLVVAVNTAIGVVQEVRADRAIAALDQLAAPTARVVRDGRDAVLPATDLVRGDLVRVVTGESVPVSRAAGEEASAGTVVTTGRAVGTVVRTGATSALGRIATLAASTRPTATPLQRRLASLGRSSASSPWCCPGWSSPSACSAVAPWWTWRSPR